MSRLLEIAKKVIAENINIAGYGLSTLEIL